MKPTEAEDSPEVDAKHTSLTELCPTSLGAQSSRFNGNLPSDGGGGGGGGFAESTK